MIIEANRHCYAPTFVHVLVGDGRRASIDGVTVEALIDGYILISCVEECRDHVRRSLYLLFFLAASASLTTFLTIFCSSIKNARTIRSLTQFAHREPPYARWTVLLGRETVAYSRGRRATICDVSAFCAIYNLPRGHFGLKEKSKMSSSVRGRLWDQRLTPGSFEPQSPHFGAVPFFLTCRYRNSPPGVLMIRTLLERVLYLFIRISGCE